MPHSAEGEVRRTRDRMSLRIRELLAQETGLTLSPVRHSRGWSERRNGSISVYVERGLPREFEESELPEDFWLACRAAMHRPALERLCHAVPSAQAALEIYSSRSSASVRCEPGLFESLCVNGSEENEAFEASKATAEAILKWIESFRPIAELLAADNDVFGLYSCRSEAGQVVAHIKLFWQPIAFVASALGVSVEAMTTVVLTHELAHAYTHLGEDTDGEAWSFNGFWASETSLIEGLAQYYTHLVCSRTDERFMEANRAFQALLPCQPDAYKSHVPWVDGFKPENVREAMRRTRTIGRGQLAEFNRQLDGLSPRDQGLRGPHPGARVEE
ncbi:MAG: hypothetical protein AMXMBFR81_14190 [Chthonomonas sp.]